MRFRTNLVLLLVLAGLGGYVYFIELPQAEQAEKAKRLFPVDAASIDHVVLEYADRKIEAVRVEDKWRLVQPVDTEADASAITTLTKAIADSTLEKELVDVEGEPAIFGLDKPLVILRASADGKDLPALRVGKTSPIGGLTYLQREGEKSILLTKSPLRGALDKKADDLRDKTIFTFSDEQVRWLEIGGERDVRLTRNNEGIWNLERPGTFAADQTALQTYLASLRSLRVASFVAESVDDLVPFGLDKARIIVRLGLADDSVKEIAFGTSKGESEVYAHTSDRQAIYTVNDYAYRNLDKGARDLRDKGLLHLASDDITAVQVVRQGDPGFKLVRSGETWSIDGVEGKLDPEAITQYVKDLADLKGYEIVADSIEDPKVFGFDAPMLQATVFGKDGATLGALLLGRIDGADGVPQFHARVESSQTVVLVRSYLVNRLEKSAADFLEAPPTKTGAASDAPPAPADDPHDHAH